MTWKGVQVVLNMEHARVVHLFMDTTLILSLITSGAIHVPIIVVLVILMIPLSMEHKHFKLLVTFVKMVMSMIIKHQLAHM